MNLDGYVDVATRHRMALAAHPELRVIEQTPTVVTVAGDTFVAVTVLVYRSPDDPLPAKATAWEPYPGRTPYTRGSEMMNASTSALGRALGMMGYGLGKSIATADEVRARQEEHTPPKAPRTPSKRPETTDGTRTPGGATQPQLVKLGALLIELNYGTRDAKLAKVAEIVGRPVTTSQELTKAEASTVIDTLETEAAPKRAVDALAETVAHTFEEARHG